ncbi:hypothetical protein Tco_1194720 [Tanacetum coccineum]
MKATRERPLPFYQFMDTNASWTSRINEILLVYSMLLGYFQIPQLTHKIKKRSILSTCPYGYFCLSSAGLLGLCNAPGTVPKNKKKGAENLAGIHHLSDLNIRFTGANSREQRINKHFLEILVRLLLLKIYVPHWFVQILQTYLAGEIYLCDQVIRRLCFWARSFWHSQKLPPRGPTGDTMGANYTQQGKSSMSGLYWPHHSYMVAHSRVEEENTITNVENAVFDLSIVYPLCFLFIDQGVLPVGFCASCRSVDDMPSRTLAYIGVHPMGVLLRFGTIVSPSRSTVAALRNGLKLLALETQQDKLVSSHRFNIFSNWVRQWRKSLQRSEKFIHEYSIVFQSYRGMDDCHLTSLERARALHSLKACDDRQYSSSMGMYTVYGLTQGLSVMGSINPGHGFATSFDNIVIFLGLHFFDFAPDVHSVLFHLKFVEYIISGITPFMSRVPRMARLWDLKNLYKGAAFSSSF